MNDWWVFPGFRIGKVAGGLYLVDQDPEHDFSTEMEHVF